MQVAGAAGAAGGLSLLDARAAPVLQGAPRRVGGHSPPWRD